MLIERDKTLEERKIPPLAADDQDYSVTVPPDK